MSNVKRRNDELERTAIHEAGHTMVAVRYSIPIIRVTILNEPHMHRGRYRPECSRLIGLRRLVTLCLAGPEAERVFCGPIRDGGDKTDQRMARVYLSARLASDQIEAELSCCQDAAAQLVRSKWGKRIITRIADALLARGTLSGNEVSAIVGRA